MAVLDLQGLTAKSATSNDTPMKNSGSSKGCNNHSGLSLLICG